MAHKTDEDETSPTQAVAVDADVESMLRASGIHYVWGEIGEGSLKLIHMDVLLKHYLRSFTQPIQLIINSPGGDLNETNSLIDLLCNQRLKVSAAGFGTCASAAAMLLACGTRGLRTVAKHTAVMVHVYSWGSTGSHHELLAHRKAEDFTHEREVAFWLKHSKYTSRRAVEKHLLKNEDNWMTAEEAVVEHGIADQIGSVYEVPDVRKRAGSEEK